ncbi:hypothetical protein MJ634_003930 [Providencia rettgeri]|uniref:hypothetical protein n=1 Tax=Providencia rettgeri TaxID=587 RepID=UPI001B383057|nr:hypothetical protein [Providencia rettgeri]MBQ0607187.1 hypothetical protein [Providencia rettgeri]MCJ2222208.1 hypothetical protein [Providencia rettgeri]MDY0820015.1 hypothetical protein [Providencia rettgeri]
MDKSRQQFEAFINDGDFPWLKASIPIMWMVWQASRESLEIELPDKYTLEYMQDDLSDSECDFFKCDDIKNELLSNGVKIKNG